MSKVKGSAFANVVAKANLFFEEYWYGLVKVVDLKQDRNCARLTLPDGNRCDLSFSSPPSVSAFLIQALRQLAEFSRAIPAPFSEFLGSRPMKYGASLLRVAGDEFHTNAVFTGDWVLLEGQPFPDGWTLGPVSGQAGARAIRRSGSPAVAFTVLPAHTSASGLRVCVEDFELCAYVPDSAIEDTVNGWFSGSTPAKVFEMLSAELGFAAYYSVFDEANKPVKKVPSNQDQKTEGSEQLAELETQASMLQQRLERAEADTHELGLAVRKAKLLTLCVKAFYAVLRARDAHDIASAAEEFAALSDDFADEFADSGIDLAAAVSRAAREYAKQTSA